VGEGTSGPRLEAQVDQLELASQVLDEGLRILCTPALRSAYEFNLANGPDVTSETQESPATPTPEAAPVE